MIKILLFIILMVLLFGSAAVLSFFKGALALGVTALLLIGTVAVCMIILMGGMALCVWLFEYLANKTGAFRQGATLDMENQEKTVSKIRSPVFWGWSAFILVVMSLLIGNYFGIYDAPMIALARWYYNVH